MDYFDNLSGSIGNTPMVILNNITKDLACKVWAKYETFNPGNSVKDRIGLKMILDAEEKGYLNPGGTIVEGTSGNTGTGLAIAGISRGYKFVFVTTDKQSDEKINVLKAYGANVIICPTNVEADDENSYYSVAKRLGNEIKDSWYVNQYDNPSNPDAHYESTGPEIWEQTDGKVTHFVVGVGTGGTISGVGKFLKEKNSNIKIWGVDSYGSVLKKFHETGVFDKSEIYPYFTEGIGEDMIPKNINFDIIDGFTKVTDTDAAIFCRELLKKEGMFLGNSAGAAIKGVLQLKENFKPQDLVVVLFHDHGSRYLKKIYNDDWMSKMGYM